MQHTKAGLYIWDVVCLLSGATWVFEFNIRLNSIFRRWNQVLHIDVYNSKFICIHVMEIFVLQWGYLLIFCGYYAVTKPPGTLWATPDLLRYSFTFTFIML